MIKDSKEDSGFRIDKTKEAVLQLSSSDSESFRDWFNEFEANAWDDQFESDVGEGRLNALADEALEDVRLGRSTEL